MTAARMTAAACLVACLAASDGLVPIRGRVSWMMGRCQGREEEKTTRVEKGAMVEDILSSRRGSIEASPLSTLTASPFPFHPCHRNARDPTPREGGGGRRRGTRLLALRGGEEEDGSHDGGGDPADTPRPGGERGGGDLAAAPTDDDALPRLRRRRDPVRNPPRWLQDVLTGVDDRDFSNVEYDWWNLV